MEFATFNEMNDMKINIIVLFASAFMITSGASAESGSKDTNKAVTLHTDSPDMSLTFGGKFIAGWKLGTPGKVDIEDLSDLTNGKSGRLCIVSGRKKACRRLGKGEAGNYAVKYRGEIFPARLKI